MQICLGQEVRVECLQKSPHLCRVWLHAITSSRDVSDKAGATVDIIHRNFVPTRHIDVPQLMLNGEIQVMNSLSSSLSADRRGRQRAAPSTLFTGTPPRPVTRKSSQSLRS